jgi:hypothetical protein
VITGFEGSAGIAGKRVTYDVEQQLLKLNDFSADATASFPPSVGVECRVARWSNHDPHLVLFYRSLKHST